MGLFVCDADWIIYNINSPLLIFAWFSIGIHTDLDISNLPWKALPWTLALLKYGLFELDSVIHQIMDLVSLTFRFWSFRTEIFVLLYF